MIARQMDLKRTNQSGITILEVLVVLAIIAMITAVAAPRVVGYLGRAKSQTAELQIDNLVASVQLFYIDTGRYPSAAEGLSVLVDAPSGDTGDWNGPYVTAEEGVVDPWGREFIFEPDESVTGFVIRSLGRDGSPGGSGEDRDLSS